MNFKFIIILSIGQPIDEYKLKMIKTMRIFIISNLIDKFEESSKIKAKNLIDSIKDLPIEDQVKIIIKKI